MKEWEILKFFLFEVSVFFFFYNKFKVIIWNVIIIVFVLDNE